MSYEDYFKEASSSMKLEEKIKLIKSNIAASASLTREIRSGGGYVKNTLCITTPSSDNSPSEIKCNNENTDKTTNDLYNKISMLDINGLTEEEIIAKLTSILNNSINPLTINRIKLLLYKEYIIYSKMLLTASSEIETIELQSSIDSITIKMDLLDELEELETEEELSDEITENNNIFFLVSRTGNVIALESLRKNVPKDYYPAFKELILGLKKGKLKGVKKLKRYACFELKDFKIRVTFDRLNSGNYIILDCFMKKVNTSGSYRNMLENRAIQYQNRKDLYLENINNPEFLKQHEDYLAEILTLLDCRELEGDEENVTRTI